MTDEFKAALLRGLLHAGLVASTSFLILWTDPSVSYRSLISGSLIPALSVLGVRFIGEGWYDTAKAKNEASKLITPSGG